MNNIEQLKKKIIYRSGYRGIKEMDLILGNFVKKYINLFKMKELKQLDYLLSIDDDNNEKILPLALKLKEMNFKLIATKGTMKIHNDMDLIFLISSI